MKNLFLTLIIIIISNSYVYSQSEKLEYDNLPLINETYSMFSQFYLKNQKYHYQYSDKTAKKIIINKNTLSFIIPYGENEGIIECEIQLDKSYQMKKNGKIAYLSLFMENCINPKNHSFKWNVKVHIVSKEKNIFIVDIEQLDGEYRQLFHNTDSKTIKDLISEQKLFIEP